MLPLRRLLFGLAALWRRREKESQLEEELRFHIEEETHEREAEGMSPEDAAVVARKEFGNLTLVRESTRESWGWSSLERLFQDVRYGLRALRRSPAFALAAVLSLALGIGANTAIFSLLDAVLFRSLPVNRPEQLVIFAHHGDQALPSTGANYPLFETLRQKSKSFLDMIAFWAIEFRLRSGDGFEMTDGHYVTTNYFSLLGVRPFAGRVFFEEDFEEPVAVLSYGLWQRKFGGSPGAVGNTINVNGLPLTVIGVAPPQFFGLQLGWKPELFVPFGLQRRLSPEFGDRLALRDGTWNIAIMGRLRDGVPLEAARSEAEVLVNPWVDEFILAETGGKRGSWTRIELLPGSRGLDGLRRRYSKPLWILMAITALVLLISCGNVANLLLARAVNRQREMAVRLSIGASRKRLLRQLLTESFLFSLLGGAASLVLAVWCARLLVVLMSDPLNPLVLPVSVDVRILTFTGLVSLLTSLLFGVLPALRATRVDLSPSLKSQRAMTQSSSAGRLKGLLVTAQVALSLLLLIGAGLFVRSLSNIRGLDPGFNPDRLLLVEFNPHGLGLKGEQLRTRLHSFCEQVLQRFESVPGVQSVSLSTLTPMSGDETTRWFTTGNFTPRQMSDSVVRVNVVSPAYFATLGVPVASGRAFNSSDRAGAPRVGILNESAARFYFAGASPVGKTFRLGRENASPAIEIIGVVGDTKQRDPREPTVRSVFLPFDQSPDAIGSIQVRSMGEASSLIPALRAAARSVSADVPISSIRTVREQVDANLSRERMIATLSASFGALALFLAAVGLYGVISYSVSTRTGEIGIRMALGADASGVLGLVGREAARLVCVGVTVGLVAAFAFTRFIEGSMLFGLTPTDGATFAIATLTLAAIAGLAVLIPAVRAARIDPTVALRHE